MVQISASTPVFILFCSTVFHLLDRDFNAVSIEAISNLTLQCMSPSNPNLYKTSDQHFHCRLSCFLSECRVVASFQKEDNSLDIDDPALMETWGTPPDSLGNTPVTYDLPVSYYTPVTYYIPDLRPGNASQDCRVTTYITSATC